MHYLEARPRRFAVLFSQLAASPRFADALQKEDHERSAFDRAVLSFNAALFATRASFA
jgi:hypothetical protein